MGEERSAALLVEVADLGKPSIRTFHPYQSQSRQRRRKMAAAMVASQACRDVAPTSPAPGRSGGDRSSMFNYIRNSYLSSSVLGLTRQI